MTSDPFSIKYPRAGRPVKWLNG